MQNVSLEPTLIVAADYPNAEQAMVLVNNLKDLPLWLKVGLELFTAEGPMLVKRIKDIPLNVFLDLKFHDIPNTVRGSVHSGCALGVRMLTLHLSGGEAMCRAAVAGRQAYLDEVGGVAPLLMGISVLTSDSGDADAIRKLVVERACMAKDAGIDGIVCSGYEVKAVKEACGKDFICLCPGIRFAGTAGGDDQARACTPEQAVANGANFIVIGRPITKSDNPRKAAEQALSEMRYSK